MKKNKTPQNWTEWLLLIAYLAMIALFVYLAFFSKSQAEGLANVIVNIVMFAIVGIIFFNCEKNSFMPLNSLIEDLNRAEKRIRQDAMHAHDYLWGTYKPEKEDFFKDAVLKEQYRDYLYEMDRIGDARSAYYKCDIEDYINYELTDAIIHRNLLNQVPGAMTGLGILGTFIGLSLGLQSFNTGTTAQITNSIAPLMDGIKVAFHTSIYGMIFSLIFNYVYKRKIEEAEASVHNFLQTYRKYVVPDTATDGVNRMMDLQKEQTDAIKDMTSSMSRQLSESMTLLLEPQFERFDKTLSNFGNVATRNQLDALSVVVNSFIAEMNKSLGTTFSQLSYMVDQNYQTQQENARQMESILEKTGSTAEYLNEVERQTASVIEALDTYAKDVAKIQGKITRHINLLQAREEGSGALLEQEARHMEDLVQYRSSLEASAETLSRQLAEQKVILENLQEAMLLMPKRVDETFRIIDENLVGVENHFQNTILAIRDTTEGVPENVAQSYDSLRDALERTSAVVTKLNTALDKITRGESRRS